MRERHTKIKRENYLVLILQGIVCDKCATGATVLNVVCVVSEETARVAPIIKLNFSIFIT